MRQIIVAALLALLALPALAQVPGGSEISIGRTPVIGGTTPQCLYITSTNKVGQQACGTGTAANIAVGTTTITGSTSGYQLYDNGGVLGALPRACAATTITATGATQYAVPAGATTVSVALWSGGGGGGSGRRAANSSARSGGTGGGSGVPVFKTYLASQLPSTVSVNIGAGGTGGAAATVNGTGGFDGTAGSDTTFGATPVLRARGGPKGWGGGSANTDPVAGTNSTTGGSTGVGAFGYLYSVTSNVAGSIVANMTSVNGYSGMGFGGGPGGTGGSLSGANAELLGIQAGFANWADGSLSPPVGPAAAATNGADGTNSSMPGVAGSGGGGGGPSINVGVSAGNGGTGGRGSGGGGGGASINGSLSGAGGNGGDGMAYIVACY